MIISLLSLSPVYLIICWWFFLYRNELCVPFSVQYIPMIMHILRSLWCFVVGFKKPWKMWLDVLHTNKTYLHISCQLILSQLIHSWWEKKLYDVCYHLLRPYLCIGCKKSYIFNQPHVYCCMEDIPDADIGWCNLCVASCSLSYGWGYSWSEPTRKLLADGD